MKKTKKTTKKTVKKSTAKKQIFASIILDESGSMAGTAGQTIDGFNEYIKGLQGKKEDFRITLTKFNSDRTVIVHDSVKVADVPVLTRDGYQPDATTPLYDAVGKTIVALEAQVGKKKLVGKGVIVVVITDGAENASREYTREKVFQMVEEKKKLGWTFAFLGANQDAWAGSVSLGISNNLVYNQNNTKQAFTTLCSATMSYSKGITRGAVKTSNDVFSADDAKKLQEPVK